MLDPHTEHATQLRNHWYWRPGHRPGRPFYTWHLTFERQYDLHRLVTEYQDTLADVPGLDPVPIPWLHITMQGIGFTDQVSDTDRNAIIEATRRRLAEIPAPTLTFHHATIRPEAIALHPHPAQPVHTIRSHIRNAIADVWGTDHIPEPATGYQPHLSIAYANKNAEPLPAADAIAALSTDPAQLILTSASCIALTRINHTYHWDTHATAHLAG
ncbi:MAG: 2'-5' RNA ligase family protein [Pseudonocardiaceae bacterium]